eukprot:727069-Pleurochrysis_carterae.AAC.2
MGAGRSWKDGAEKEESRTQGEKEAGRRLEGRCAVPSWRATRRKAETTGGQERKASVKDALGGEE